MALKIIGDDKRKGYVRCLCACGQKCTVRRDHVNKGTKSCGCLRSATARRLRNQLRHGGWINGQPTPEYSAYVGAKGRCTNPKSNVWKYYGGRGIKFLFTSFEQFLAEIGPRPTPQHSLDRKKNNGHYRPGNVRWATDKEQNANRRKVTDLSGYRTQELVAELRKRLYNGLA